MFRWQLDDKEVYQRLWSTYGVVLFIKPVTFVTLLRPSSLSLSKLQSE